MAELVERAGFDQAFDRGAINRARVDAFAKIVQAAKRLACCPCFGNARHRLYAAAFDRRQRVADDAIAHDREVNARFVDARSQNFNAHPARFFDVRRDLVRGAHVQRQHCRHKFGRVIRLQVGRLVGDERIGRGVALVEPIERELGDQVAEPLGPAAFDAVFQAAFHEIAPVLGHDRRVFFAHRLAQRVGFAQGKSRQCVGDEHDLFLIDDDAVGGGEDRFEARVQIADRFAPVLARDERRDVFHRPGAVHGVEGDQVVQAIGLGLAQHALHAFGFKLENALRFAAREQLVDPGIVQRDRVHVERDAMDLLDEVARAPDDGERLQAKKIDLQQADRGDHFHVVLGRYGLLARRLV